MILLNPGPVTLSEGVKAATVAEDLCHRESEFAALTLSIRDDLETIYETLDAYTAVLITGSGSAAVESMLSTFSPKESLTLVVCNGVYGERMVKMLEYQGKPHEAYLLQWGEAVDIAILEKRINELPNLTHLAIVHHETTTGRLNHLLPIAQLCEKKAISLMIDAVSSFGAEEIDFKAWKPLAVAGTANKCLHGIPGVAFVMAKTKELNRKNSYSTSLYFDLKEYFVSQKDGWSPFTQAIQAYQGLTKALEELQIAGGWRARQQLYLERSAVIEKALANLSVLPLLNLADSSCVLRAYCLPDNVSYVSLHDFLKSNGFVIYAGQGDFSKKIFRISTMGNIEDRDLNQLKQHLNNFFKDYE